MSTDTQQASEIRETLDGDLNREDIGQHPDGITAGALEFFQQFFVEQLHFDRVSDPAGRSPYGEKISTEDWSQSSRAEEAWILAEAYDFRVVYIRLEKLTRTAQRHAVQSMRAEGWAREGEFIAVFHDLESEVWHLVSPFVEEGREIGDGRTVLRRYVVGEGETHRTVARNLATMDADRPVPLYDRVQEAFRLQPVTQKFYGEYKDVRSTVYDHLRNEGLDIEAAKRYSHLLLNRLMFLYFIQKKGWINGNKTFIRTFTDVYESSNDNECFHEKWLGSLFFEAMNQPPGADVEREFPNHIQKILSNLPFLNGGLFEEKEADTTVAEKDAYLPDDVLIQEIIRGFLDSYNFTVTEESPFDLDVAVDPAMLGKIYESLIAEEERDEAGIFYTPRVEVDLMCRLALYDYFVTEADDPDYEDQKLLTNFLFMTLEEWVQNGQEDYDRVIELIHEVDIVDPACGSGAFLVGMMQVFKELYRKLGIEPDYELKEQIVNENLNGVDIKDWAVRVAEFRLWLALVEAEEEVPDAEPVLPNFRFKLHVGDSIIQKDGDEFISLDRISRRATGDVQTQLEEIQDLKNRYFKGEADLQSDIEESQTELIRTHINQRIEKLEDQKDKAGQRDLNGELTDEAQEVIAGIEGEIENLRTTAENLEEADEQGSFLWDVDFPEVMLDGGFDVVIGNPPYVRQEDIIRQDLDPERRDTFSDEKIDRLEEQYKEDLREYVSEEFGLTPGKRSDLYLYFFFKGIELLNDTGRMCYICSNSWMDIGYGGTLQEGLLTESNLKYILGNTAAKTFEESDVNTVITLAGKGGRSIDDVEFVAFNQPFIDYTYQEDLKPILIESSKDAVEEIDLDDETLGLYSGNSLRTIELGVDALWRLGGGTTKEIEAEDAGAEGGRVYSERTGVTGDQRNVGGFSSSKGNRELVGEYDRGKWGKFIDAPKLYFELWRNHSDKFQFIHQISDDLPRGITSGANKFFFVPRPGTENTTFKSSVSEATGKLLLTHKDTGEEFQIEKEFWTRPISEIPEKYRDQFEYQFEDGETVVPDLVLVKNREIQTSPVEPRHLNSVHVNIHDSKSEVADMDALEYVKLGERPIWGRTDKPISGRSTVQSRTPWHKQPTVSDASILLTRYINAEFQFHYNPCRFPVADNFHYIPELESLTAGYIAGYMNSTLGWFMAEISGRSWTNTLKFDKYEYLQLPILTEISEDKQLEVENKLEELMREDIGNVFEELGAYSPNDFSLSAVRRDRLELDTILFESVGITEASEKVEFYQEMIKMVRDRLMRQPSENPSLCETIAKHNPQYDYER